MDLTRTVVLNIGMECLGLTVTTIIRHVWNVERQIAVRDKNGCKREDKTIGNIAVTWEVYKKWLLSGTHTG